MKVLKEAETKGLVDLVANIADATDTNDHTGAVLFLAQFMKNKKAEKALEGIEQCAHYFGHMPQELGKVRTMINDDLMKQAKQKFDSEEFELIRRAF